MEDFVYRHIGIIRSPHKRPEGTPIQSDGARGVKGRVEVRSEYSDFLTDLEGFSHIILIYHFHQAKESKPLVKPYMDGRKHGLFATRSPARPNKIGLSVVKLLGIENTVLQIENVDLLDGTPLLDIKPYVTSFDYPGQTKEGWLEKRIHQLRDTTADGRFAGEAN